MFELRWVEDRDGAGRAKFTCIGDKNVSSAPAVFDEFAQAIDRMHVGQIDSPEREAIFHLSIVFSLEFSKVVVGSRDRNDMRTGNGELFGYEIPDPLGSSCHNRDLPSKVQHGQFAS